MSGFFEILWKDFILNLGQLQFFIYMFLTILTIAVLKNNINLKTLRLASMYSVATIVLEEFARSWHFKNVINHDLTARTSVIAFMAIITFVGAMWAAYAINAYTADRRMVYRYMSRRAAIVALWFMEKSDNYTDTITDKLHTHLHKEVDSLPHVHQ